MKWRDRTYDWKRAFALLPIKIGGTYVWWEWYWQRFCGDHYEVQHEFPECDECGGGPVFCRHCQHFPRKTA